MDQYIDWRSPINFKHSLNRRVLDWYAIYKNFNSGGGGVELKSLRYPSQSTARLGSGTNNTNAHLGRSGTLTNASKGTRPGETQAGMTGPIITWGGLLQMGHPIRNQTKIAMSAWVNCIPAALQYIFGWGAGVNDGVYLAASAASPYTLNLVYKLGGVDQINVTSSQTFARRWRHILLQTNGVNLYEVYVDGKLTSINGAALLPFLPSFANRNYWFGRSFLGGSNLLAGSANHLVFFNDVLSAAEVEQRYELEANNIGQLLNLYVPQKRFKWLLPAATDNLINGVVTLTGPTTVAQLVEATPVNSINGVVTLTGPTTVAQLTEATPIDTINGVTTLTGPTTVAQLTAAIPTNSIVGVTSLSGPTVAAQLTASNPNNPINGVTSLQQVTAAAQLIALETVPVDTSHYVKYQRRDLRITWKRELHSNKWKRELHALKWSKISS